MDGVHMQEMSANAYCWVNSRNNHIRAGNDDRVFMVGLVDSTAIRPTGNAIGDGKNGNT
jgi:hypothetical protein